jgi:hypothetical protein
MRKNTLFILIILVLFSCFKKDNKIKSANTSAILGMVLLEDTNSLNLEATLNELRTKWNLDVNDNDREEIGAVLVIGEYKVAIATIPAAIPEEEVEKTAAFNYLWENGVEETSKHKGHVVLSIMNAGKNAVKENILYSKIASAVMNNSNSIGIYLGSRTLVIKKDFYQANVEMMTDEDLPLYNWIYFGLREENGKQSVYTYGLEEFGQKEMEIIESKRTVADLSEMMFNLAHYVIAYNVELRDGDTIGISAEQKLKISESKGKFLEGRTLKIDY